ncbi:digestive cysteine proteinase 1 [Callorhinchus milii]|uniref:Counting factor associated protein D-like protein n=1 Tax=Callorhinchus milii TaxID=7868 RepID=V9KKU1_CALMI|nr:digestive cysteine proteinase 1 [Callorhinchus milii]|eukprot:gi/632954369/ref/XP_007892928.1/ PREDICTED: digestive cysteine proteinase 1-like [Callorhinchus milii]
MGTSWCWFGAALLSCFAGLESKFLTKVPSFGDIYHVAGILSLPYAEIEEPFEAWYNLSGRVSRIEFYHGQVVTLQHGFVKPAGVGYKISPETTETEINVIKCFQAKGTVKDPILPQSIFPSLEGFQPIKEEEYKGRLCTVWQHVVYEGKKKNTYTIWITNSSEGSIPIHYEMKGFNTLLGSHYDKYEIDYTDLQRIVDPSIFKLPAGLTCEEFPGPGVEHRMAVNPIQDFVSPEREDQSHHLFQHYKEKFDKDYDPDEHEFRKNIFVHNLRYIHSMNRANLTFKMEINHLADRTVDEVGPMRGRQRRTKPNNGRPFPAEHYESVLLPASMDWRLYGAVTPVKDQAVCGSCWSFGTTGAVEGALFLKTGNLISLSQQMLIDCSWGFGNNACDGGEEWRSYEWMMKHGGISTAESYGPYMGQNGYCHYNQSTLTAKLKSYTNVTSGDIEALKFAIYKNGPAAVGIDASQKSFRFYSNGVYYEPKCGSKPEDLDHAVLAVGYGTLDGEPYWLVKNSWSTYWGNDGYVLMSMKDNNCGVATDATYVTLE